MATLLQAVEQLSGVEARLAELRSLLLRRQAQGRLTARDVARYDQLRFRLYTVEMECYGKYALAARDLASMAGFDGNLIPLPAMSPGVDVRVTGLGAVPIAAGLGGWATFLLTVAGVVLILGAIAIGALLIYNLATLAEHAGTQLAYYQSQEQLALDCAVAGRTPAECAALLAANRPPADPKPPEDPKSLLMIAGAAVLGGLVLVILGSNQSGGNSRDGIVLRVGN